MNSCQMPYLKMSPKRFSRVNLYELLSSASSQDELEALLSGKCICVNLYELLSSTSSWNEPHVLLSGNYMVLFSASKHTNCAPVVCGSQWVTVALHSMFFNSHQSGVLTALFGCYMVVPCETMLYHHPALHSIPGILSAPSSPHPENNNS